MVTTVFNSLENVLQLISLTIVDVFDMQVPEEEEENEERLTHGDYSKTKEEA